MKKRIRLWLIGGILIAVASVTYAVAQSQNADISLNQPAPFPVNM